MTPADNMHVRLERALDEVEKLERDISFLERKIAEKDLELDRLRASYLNLCERVGGQSQMITRLAEQIKSAVVLGPDSDKR